MSQIIGKSYFFFIIPANLYIHPCCNIYKIFRIHGKFLRYLGFNMNIDKPRADCIFNLTRH